MLYNVEEYCTRADGLIWKPTGNNRGEYQRVGHFEYHRDGPLLRIQLDKLEACLCGRGDAREKMEMTEELYETYDEEKDVYTFTIV
jgi:hypothetical protein